jgi:ABC-type nitrate/sulfonate/bicarbonate transport system permease component
MTPLVKKLVTAVWLPVAGVLLWQVWATLAPHPFFPQPSAIAEAFFSLANIEWFVVRVFPTVSLAVGGYLAGCVVGVSLGLIIGSHPFLFRAFGPMAVFIRSIPSAAVIPVIMAIFGIGMVTLYVAVIVAVAFQVTLVTMLAVSQTENTYLDTARIVGMSGLKIFFLVRVPASTGKILTGLQAALQVALLVAVTVETLAAGVGMGRFASEALDTLRLSHMWIAVVVLGAIGVFLHWLYGVTEKRLAPWYFGLRKESQATQ